MAKKETCGGCFYYESLGDTCGECYCNPPVNDGNDETTIDRGATVLKSRRACGDFKPK